MLLNKHYSNLRCFVESLKRKTLCRPCAVDYIMTPELLPALLSVVSTTRPLYRHPRPLSLMWWRIKKWLHHLLHQTICSEHRTDIPPTVQVSLTWWRIKKWKCFCFPLWFQMYKQNFNSFSILGDIENWSFWSSIKKKKQNYTCSWSLKWARILLQLHHPVDPVT